MTFGLRPSSAAALLVLLIGAAASSDHATAGVNMSNGASANVPGSIFLYPGETALEAITNRGVAVRQAALHATWLQSGHSEVSYEEKQALALTSGTVLSNTLQVGDAFALPAIQFAYTAGIPGLNQASFAFTSTRGGQILEPYYAQAVYSKRGTISFAFPSALPFYLAPGEWTLTGATLYDNSGNSISYTAAQIAALFTATSFTVVNHGLVDSQPPALGVGHLLTPTVSLSSASPILKATLPVSDNLSGVGAAFLFLSQPGQNYGQAEDVTIPVPIKLGTVTLYHQFNYDDPTGVWNFYQVLVCDVAQNCVSISDPQAIFNLLGANSVVVTH